MTLLRWAEVDRETLGAAMPEALIVLPVGAIEQHGRHLATGTDALLASTVAERAAAEAAGQASRTIVLAPGLPFGASNHHLPFGATLSLTAETLLAVLLDLLRSVATSGGRRLVLVNGHGGNVGVCHAAAAAASSRHGIVVAHVNYWRMLGKDVAPGHAGELETSLVAAVRPDLVRTAAARPDVPEVAGVDGVDIHDPGIWGRLDGYTDRPESADASKGATSLQEIVSGLSRRLVELATIL